MTTKSSGFVNTTSWSRGAFAVVTVAALALSGCSADKKDDSAAATKTTAVTTTTTTDSESMSAAAESHGEFHLHDGFVKAAKKGGMTAVFGTLENHGDKPVHLVGFTSSVSAKMYQIHEVVDGKMQQKKDGIVIGAGKRVELKPGGDHLMLMGLTEDVAAGSTVDVTLRFEDGHTVTVKGLPVRQMAAGNEKYAGGHGESDHEHSGHGDSMHSGMHMDGDGKDDHDATPMTSAQMSSTAAHQ